MDDCRLKKTEYIYLTSYSLRKFNVWEFFKFIISIKFGLQIYFLILRFIVRHLSHFIPDSRFYALNEFQIFDHEL